MCILPYEQWIYQSALFTGNHNSMPQWHWLKSPTPYPHQTGNSLPAPFTTDAEPWGNHLVACAVRKKKKPRFLDLFYAKSIKIRGNSAKKRKLLFYYGVPSGVLYSFTFYNCSRDPALLSVHRGQTSAQMCKIIVVLQCPRLTCRLPCQERKAKL